MVHRCNECGQPLPETYEPPGTEPWTSGIFGCADDMDTCTTPTLFLVLRFAFVVRLGSEFQMLRMNCLQLRLHYLIVLMHSAALDHNISVIRGR